MTQTNKPIVLIKDRQQEDYATTWQAMRDFVATRTEVTNDEIWFVEHPAVYTLGQAGKIEHLLNPNSIPVVQSDRGGQITYHGPGQLVAYLLIDLKRLQIGVRQFVTLIEQAIIELLNQWQIPAESRADAPGIYVANKKIASLGLRIRKGYSYHGLSLNVAMDLVPFSYINPCGQVGLVMTQLADLGVHDDMNVIKQSLSKILLERLQNYPATATNY